MNDSASRKGKIITFYSYKGGVGRSMALANISIVLAQWGYKVLIIDWDLEAPGLENFFKDHLSIPKTNEKAGLIDLLISESKSSDTTERIHWKDCVIPVHINTLQAKVDLITAGVIDDKYYEKVRSFDFSKFYSENEGSKIIETLRYEWALDYDFILIDSRTGVTDIGGVCTVQLPDILVILFTPTDQSLQGVKRVALKAMAAQRKLPYDRINLLTLPVATRIDNTEFELTKEWFKKFEVELKEIYLKWIPENYSIDLKEFLLNSKVPYISYFSFGEALPVVKASLTDPTGMSYAYVSIAALLANKLDFAYLLLTDRSGLIKNAFTTDKEVNATWRKEIRKNVVKTVFTKQIRPFLTSKISLIVVLIILIGSFLLFNFISRQKFEKYKVEFLETRDSITAANNYRVDSLLRSDSIKNSIINNNLDPGKIALTNAQLELSKGARSENIGKNDGVFVTKYNEFSGLTEGYPWAATFVSWCFNHEVRFFRPSGSVTELESYFASNASNYFKYGENFFPQPGDIYFYDWKESRAIGIVESYSPNGNILIGIEGNSNNEENGVNYKVAKVSFNGKELSAYNFTVARVKRLISETYIEPIDVPAK
jgi:MinD-like ATPase involved in chromosome partitioning or flagellar assembly